MDTAEHDFWSLLPRGNIRSQAYSRWSVSLPSKSKTPVSAEQQAMFRIHRRDKMIHVSFPFSVLIVDIFLNVRPIELDSKDCKEPNLSFTSWQRFLRSPVFYNLCVGIRISCLLAMPIYYRFISVKSLVVGVFNKIDCENVTDYRFQLYWVI